MEKPSKFAPPGMFRVIGLTDPEEYPVRIGDYKWLEQAKDESVVDPQVEYLKSTFVYDDKGVCVHVGKGAMPISELIKDMPWP